MSKNVIYLDVDGVLNFDDKCEGFFDHYVDTGPREEDKGYVRLNKNHGPWLLKLAKETDSELVWATSWLGLANIWIGPAIGLPELPFVDFGFRKFSQSNSSWKANGMNEHADDRPFIWFDDDFFIPDLLETGRKHEVHLVNGKSGITKADIVAAYLWLTTP